MTGLIINAIISSGIFGVPGELTHLLGRASPIAMVFAALGMAIIMAVITELASQFSDPGGPYFYVRTAFGRFFGIQIGWFWLLAIHRETYRCPDPTRFLGRGGFWFAVRWLYGSE